MVAASMPVKESTPNTKIINISELLPESQKDPSPQNMSDKMCLYTQWINMLPSNTLLPGQHSVCECLGLQLKLDESAADIAMEFDVASMQGTATIILEIPES